MKKLLKILLILVCFSTVQLQGQDLNFSQFYEMPLLRNPALAGIYKGDVRATSAYRSQWASVTVPYKTVAVGVETKFGISQNTDDYLSVGLQVTNDIAGDSKLGKTQILPMVAMHKILNNTNSGYLTLAFMGGPVQQRFDPSGLKFDDQFVNGAYSALNPTRQVFNNTNVTYWDPSVGLSFSNILGYDTKFYAGVGYFHFLKPRVAFSSINDIRLNPKLTLNVGCNTMLGDMDRLILYLDYFMQGGNNQAQGGFMVKHDFIQDGEEESLAFSAGGFYRWNDALMPVIKLDYYSLGIGVSYDINMSKLRTASTYRGGLEVTVSYKSFLNIRNSSLQKMRCVVPF
jgi:type IX secretion system PorP/SprF family membrane protein